MRTMGLLLLGLAATVGAEPSTPAPLVWSLTPHASMPLAGDAASFGFGGGADASLDYLMPWPALSVGLTGGYEYWTTGDPSLSLSAADGGLETGVSLAILPTVDLRLGATAGYYYAMTNATPKASGAATSGADPFVGGRLGLAFRPSEYFSLSVDGGYRGYLGLVNGASLAVSAHFSPAGNAPFVRDAVVPAGFAPLGQEKKGVQLIGLKSTPLFPIFKNWYDDHEVAEVVLHNYSPNDVDGVVVTAEVKGYMDSPRDLKVPAKLAGGQTLTIPVPALFNDKLLTVSEATRLTLTLTVKSTQQGQTSTVVSSPTLDVLYRNAITWDDDRHVAAFISSRDPAANGYVRDISSTIRDHRNPAISQNLQLAIAVHEALKRHGVIYSKVPTSAFNRGDRVTVDSVQFPQETLRSKTGDCSDLTVLWCSLLESVGVETAAITVPGHIYMAFALEGAGDQAATLGDKDKFLWKDGKAWVPVETTMITDSFLDAWKEGARESSPTLNPKLAFYPIHTAWKEYPPVVVSGTATAPMVPAGTALTDALALELKTLVQRELEPRVAKLQGDLKTASNPAKVTNSLGLLYARFGQYPTATKVLSDLISKQQYGPAFVNLGNLDLLQKDYKGALDVFRRWQSINPDDSAAVAGEALALDALGDRTASATAFDRLNTLDPKLAQKYQYLNHDSSGGRAAEAGQLEQILSWKE